MRFRCAGFLVSCLLAVACARDAAPRIESGADRIGYSLGYQIGGDLEGEGREVDVAALQRGLEDGLRGSEPSIPREQMDALLVELKRGITLSERERRLGIARGLRAEGRRFLAANATEPGVVTLPSGLQYRVLREGTGERPTSNDRVRVRYRTTELAGKVVYDSDRDGEPDTLHVSGVVRGLGEALQQMREGARWQLFLGPDLGYGRRGPLADHTVIIDVELIAIERGERR